MSLNKIKVSREEILKIVEGNKEKHDQILKEAIEGYWIEAEAFSKKHEKETLDLFNKNHREQLKKLRKQRKEAIKTLKDYTKKDLEIIKNKDKIGKFTYWNGKYPEDHGDEYIGTIRRLELCVDKEVELDTNEFDSYIRNKWTWRDSFLTCNTGYVTSYYGSGSVGIGLSGPCGPAGNVGSYISGALSSSLASF